ncbi:hypothetical protein TKK_0011497 [Trichogramma kaykai]|uniref:Uncharacterized protein n=1 Tax=Trichogramma kaykai TaxID=54128 RepID=A0ABD2WQL2_9HYME
MMFFHLVSCALFVHSAVASSMIVPPHSAVVFAFEDVYDLSLLAHTLSDQSGVETTLVIAHDEHDFYEHMIDVDIIRINATFKDNNSKEERALKLCDAVVSDNKLKRRLDNPTFVVFPGMRHDACLLPWIELIPSIPVVWARGFDEEIYAFVKTGMALPLHETGFVQSFIENLNLNYLLFTIQRNYITPAQKIIKSRLPQANIDLDSSYKNVQLVLWGADPVLRMNSAPLTQLVTEIGCHHCRGVQPLPAEDLQKFLVEYRSGSIVVLLDADYDTLVTEIAEKLPSDRQGMAVVWKNKHVSIKNKPKNLAVHKTVDRQDLIGYSRVRLVLSHCSDSEFLEAAFHGTPLICLPRNVDELRNAQRAVELGFAATQRLDTSKSDDLVELIKTIHENTSYREKARLVSTALRDRSNHAMDRLTYWLRYIARHNDEGRNLLLPKKVSTYAEFWQTIVGFLFGVLFTAIATVIFFITQDVSEHQKKKDKKMRHRN